MHQEPPEVAWLEPELDDGADDELPRLLELELEPEELEPDDPELELEEPELALPMLLLGELLGDGELLLLLGELVLLEAVLAEPGNASAIAPAASTLAAPTVAVVVVTRPLARRRAATARATTSRFGLFIVEVSPYWLGSFSTEFLSRL